MIAPVCYAGGTLTLMYIYHTREHTLGCTYGLRTEQNRTG